MDDQTNRAARKKQCQDLISEYKYELIFKTEPTEIADYKRKIARLNKQIEDIEAEFDGHDVSFDSMPKSTGNLTNISAKDSAAISGNVNTRQHAHLKCIQ